MTTRTVSLAQFAKEMRELGPKLERTIVRGIQSTAHRMPEIVREELHRTSPSPAIATGELARSTKVDPTKDGAIVGMDAPHAAFIEEGTRPHFPPLQPLRDWARMKFGGSESEINQIAFLVARKISRDGIEPRHYFKASVDRVEELLGDEIKREIYRELGR